MTAPVPGIQHSTGEDDRPHAAARRSSIGSSPKFRGLQAASDAQVTPWTLQQSFFSICGGLTVDTSSFWHEPSKTITARETLELAKAGLLPEIIDKELTDKSKADSLGKILVCVQASWFLLQSIARLVQNLPLTLLEIHVLSQVLCALAMYICWAEKPYNVGVPLEIEDERVKDIVALFLLDSVPRSSANEETVSYFLFYSWLHESHRIVVS